MAFQPVPDTAAFILRYSLAGAGVQSTIYVQDTVVGAWDEAKLLATAQTIETWWDSDVKPLQSSAITLDTITGRDLENEFGAFVDLAVGSAGTVVGDALPASVTAVIKLAGDPGSPPRFGLLHHPGLAESQVAGSTIAGATVTALSTAYNNLRADISAAVVTEAQVVVSRFAGKTLVDFPNGERKFVPTKRATGDTNTIASVTCRAIVGSQRDRRPGEGS